jgi:SpoVK/Ycf46/Vps4 family AAA+-type ATPase
MYCNVGKTLMAMEIARELCGGFFTIKLNEVVRGHVGEGERTLRTLLSDAKANAPCVVFIDEFQSIFAARGAEEGSSGSVGVSLTAALAAALDDVAAWNASAGSQSLITVLAASNEPWAIDSGFLRPGRLDRCVFVGPMDAAGVEQLFAKEFELFSFMDGAVEVDRCSVLADVGVHLAGKYTGAQLRHAMKGLKLRHVKERVKMVKEASHGEFDDLRIDIRIIFEWAQAPLKNMESSLEKYRYFESLR